MARKHFWRTLAKITNFIHLPSCYAENFFNSSPSVQFPTKFKWSLKRVIFDPKKCNLWSLSDPQGWKFFQFSVFRTLPDLRGVKSENRFLDPKNFWADFFRPIRMPVAKVVTTWVFLTNYRKIAYWPETHFYRKGRLFSCVIVILVMWVKCEQEEYNQHLSLLSFWDIGNVKNLENRPPDRPCGPN